jgi:hypothetical protein
VSTLLCEESVKGLVLGGVVGRVVLPAGPEDACPGAAEDADCVGVVGAASAGALVDVVRPWVPAAGAVGECVDVCSKSLVADCAHRSSSPSGVRLKCADQEVPWRVLIDRPSVGQRPVAALGASHHREALVSCGPSKRQATQALSQWWSAICAEQSQAPSDQTSDRIALSRNKKESSPATQQPKVLL